MINNNAELHCKIVHFSTVHPRDDIRIRTKELPSLAQSYGTVAFVVQDGQGDAVESDGQIIIRDVGAPGGRFLRATRGSWRMWRAVRKLRPTVAHFHDPELIPVALLLKYSGIKIIYDVHEDVPRQILTKDWLPEILKRPIAVFMEVWEILAGKVFDNVVVVTPRIMQRFPCGKTVMVQNFAQRGELQVASNLPFQQRPPLAVYVGRITKFRGAFEIVNAMGCLPETSDLRLSLAGAFLPPETERELSKLSGWRRVEFHGWLGREDVSALLSQARMGLVVLRPMPSYVDSLPVKLFEYMSAGLPVIASDFPLWREIIEGAGCGLLVDPMDPSSIAEAMSWLLDHPEEATAMGERGQRAVEDVYNWNREAGKLVSLYADLFGREGSAKSI